MTVKMKINVDKLHHKYSLLTFKASIPSLVNTLNKNIITIDVYDTYVYNFRDCHHVELFNL